MHPRMAFSDPEHTSQRQKEVLPVHELCSNEKLCDRQGKEDPVLSLLGVSWIEQGNILVEVEKVHPSRRN